MKNVNCFLALTIIVAIVIAIIFGDLLLYIIITLTNNYRRKQFIDIKSNGNCLESTIIMASNYSKGYGKYRWLLKDSGYITVMANNRTYTIMDIDYNDEFKMLKKELDDIFQINAQKYNKMNQCLKTNKEEFFSKEIKVRIYVLDNKVVADLASISKM